MEQLERIAVVIRLHRFFAVFTVITSRQRFCHVIAIFFSSPTNRLIPNLVNDVFCVLQVLVVFDTTINQDGLNWRNSKARVAAWHALLFRVGLFPQRNNPSTTKNLIHACKIFHLQVEVAFSAEPCRCFIQLSHVLFVSRIVSHMSEVDCGLHHRRNLSFDNRSNQRNK